MTEWFKCSEVDPPVDREVLVYTGESFGVGNFVMKQRNGYYFDGFGPIWGVTH